MNNNINDIVDYIINRFERGEMCIRDRAKVARGELEKGMSPMAVLLAWGEPEQKMAGRMTGKNTERWI